jgi:hypothetical protein
VCDGSRATKISNTQERIYPQRFYDAPRTTAKNYFSPLAISIPAASTLLNLTWHDVFGARFRSRFPLIMNDHERVQAA